MSISEIAIKRPVFTTMITLGWVVLGLLGFSRLGTDLYPDVKFPFVTIAVPYPGAAPEDVERQIVKPLEDAVVAVNGVDRVEGFARDNVGVIAVVFKLVAVFVPVAFMDGIVGQFFRQFGLTVTAAVLLSMVVAFTLDPMLSARLAKRIVPGASHETGAKACPRGTPSSPPDRSGCGPSS